MTSFYERKCKNFILMSSLMKKLLLCAFFLPMLSLNAANVLFHVKTALNVDDAQICVVPNVAMASLDSGDKVTILFDGSAVTSITQGWGWFVFETTTPMDKASLPERERNSLSKQFNIPLEEIPQNYGDYFRFLKKKGVEVYVNKTMLTLYNIEEKDVQIANPVDLKNMMNLFKEAEVTIVY